MDISGRELNGKSLFPFSVNVLSVVRGGCSNTNTLLIVNTNMGLNKKKKNWTVHCLNCLRILGVSSMKLHYKNIYCMDCAKKELKETQSD